MPAAVHAGNRARPVVRTIWAARHLSRVSSREEALTPATFRSWVGIAKGS